MLSPKEKNTSSSIEVEKKDLSGSIIESIDSPEINLEEVMQKCLVIMDEGKEIVMKYWHMINNNEKIDSATKISDDMKTHGSPVTIADREAEDFFKKKLMDLLPGSNFEGEETGVDITDATSEFTRLLDPIDKTRQFEAGQYNFGIIFALKWKGEIVLGISCMPALNEVLYAYKGGGAFLNGKKVMVSDKKYSSKALITHERDKYFEKMGEGAMRGLSKLKKDTYCTIDSLQTFHYIASGKAEGHVSPPVYIYDMAPFLVIIPEAGGKVTQMNGNPINLLSGDKVTALFTNGVCHKDILACFNS